MANQGDFGRSCNALPTAWRLTGDGSADDTFTYDNNGNLLTVTNPPSPPGGPTTTLTYAWDFENRLTSQTITTNPPSTTSTFSFKYDPFGRRIQKSSASGTTNFAYDGDSIVEELDANGNSVARYAQGLGIDEPLAMLRSGVTSYYEADGLGSITSLTDTTGNAAERYGYDSFGNPVYQSGNLTNPFQFTARERDSETALYYYRARYYDTSEGRFLNEDPLRFFSGDVNFYAYVSNNSINFIDPTGLSCGCTYSEATGHLVCKDEGGKVLVDASGYAGLGPGKNNPGAVDQEGVGPIPTGTYDIHPPVNRPKTVGKYALPLTRRGGRAGGFPANRGPDSFLIHGDSNKHPGQASHGCPIIDRKDREHLWNSDCKELNVIP